MGKSTAAAMLRGFGVPLFDADRVVHALLAPAGKGVLPVSEAFCGVQTGTGGIDRTLLGQRVFADAAALSRLERILHPMVAAEERRFLAGARARHVQLVVLDIPLLFETGADCGRSDISRTSGGSPVMPRLVVLTRRPASRCNKLASLQR